MGNQYLFCSSGQNVPKDHNVIYYTFQARIDKHPLLTNCNHWIKSDKTNEHIIIKKKEKNQMIHQEGWTITPA